MHLQLDGRGPLHAQLTRALKSAVFAGRVSQGARLPATRQLARELGVSRNTVLAAYDQLRAEGFVDGRVGSGSYVTPPLQTGAARLHAVDAPLPAQSQFARRARVIHDHLRIPGRSIPGVRYTFQYGVPLTNPALTSAWARELAHAAAYTSPTYPTSQGLLALREAVCDYLARRRRGVQAAAGGRDHRRRHPAGGGADRARAARSRRRGGAGRAALLGDARGAADPRRAACARWRSTRRAWSVRGLAVAGAEAGLRDAVAPVPQRRGAVAAAAAGVARLRAPPRQLDPRGRLRRRVPLRRPAAGGAAFARRQRPGDLRRHLLQGDVPVAAAGLLVVPPGLRGDFVNAKWQDDFGSCRHRAGGAGALHRRRRFRAPPAPHLEDAEGTSRGLLGWAAALQPRTPADQRFARRHASGGVAEGRATPSRAMRSSRVRAALGWACIRSVRTTSTRPTAPACCSATARCR